MSDDFERRLEQLFAHGPPLDAEAFAARVQARLDRGWTVRRLVIGVFGVAGGLTAASQLVVANLFERLESASVGSSAALASVLRAAVPDAPRFVAVDTGAIWMAAALAAVAGGYVLSRMLREI